METNNAEYTALKTSTFQCECPDHKGDRTVTVEHYGFTTGYGIDSENRKCCHQCCADMDRKTMLETGKIGMYLTHTKRDNSRNGWEVSNWPGSIRFAAFGYSKSHLAAFGGYIERETAHFIGPDGYEWWIDVRGDMECGMARRMNSGKWYCGHVKDGGIVVFRCNFKPTESSHGHLFFATTGGFATKAKMIDAIHELRRGCNFTVKVTGIDESEL